MLHYRDYNKYVSELLECKKISGDRFCDVNQIDRISFTPYVYNTCSANCAFCSEKLVRDGKVMACDTICEDYEKHLQSVFRWLKNHQVFLSVSGKEPSESVEQVRLILDEANKFEEAGGIITDRVMYTNLSGFAKRKEELFSCIEKGKISRIECSRHHFNEQINQSIVNFRPSESIKENKVFKNVVKELGGIVPVSMVCVMQKAGISTKEEVESYLEFAVDTGVKAVVFRELAMFDDAVEDGCTTKYIVDNRVELMDIIKELDEKTFTNLKVTKGYYYFSFEYKYKGMRVAFEMSDYEEMIKCHNDDSKLNKVILYPNGMVCKDWNMKGQITIDEK